jgi:hypothetical protein
MIIDFSTDFKTFTIYYSEEDLLAENDGDVYKKQ